MKSGRHLPHIVEVPANHFSTASNLDIKINIPCRKCEEWTLSFQRLKHFNRVKHCLTLNKSFKISK